MRASSWNQISRSAWSLAGRRDERSARARSFFICFDNPLVLSRMARPRANVRKAEFLEKLADIAGVVVDAEALGDDPLEIDPSPAHHAVDFPIRTRLDDPGELGQLIGRQPRLGTARPIVEEAIGSCYVEAMNPVAQGLAIHSCDLSRLAAVHSVPNRSQRQKPSAL